MEDKKSIFLSKTFWGATIAILAVGLKYIGLEFGPIEGFADDLVIFAGACFAIYGRVKAIHKIG